ncbi:MAG: CrcB family protein [Gaiellales bacterium]
MSSVLGWIAVGPACACGALARFAIDGAVSRRTRSSFPSAILAINVSGSLALGVLAGAGVSGWSLRLAGAALLGSYTTFSTFVVDAGRMAQTPGDRSWALLNLVASLVLGLAAVSAGWAIGGFS